MWLQRVVGVLAAEYLRFVWLTNRFSFEPAEVYEIVEPEMPFILAFWHGQHFMTPFIRKDLARLRDFLAVLPGDHRAAFEFRHASWFDDGVYALLQGAGAALCLSEREDDAPPPLVETAPWGYVRLRLEDYLDDELGRWAQRLRATSWTDAYVYFMHEPTAPAYATTLLHGVEEGHGG